MESKSNLMLNKKDRRVLVEEFMNLGYEPFNEVWYSYTKELRNEFSLKEVFEYTYVVPIHSDKYSAYKILTDKVKNLLIDTFDYLLLSYKDLGPILIEDFDAKYTTYFFRNEILNKDNMDYFRDKYLDYAARGIAGIMLLVMVEEYQNLKDKHWLIEDEMVMQLLGIVDNFINGLEDDYTYMETVITPNVHAIYDTIVHNDALIEDVRTIRDLTEKRFGKGFSISGIVNVNYNKNTPDAQQDFRYEFIIFNLTYY